jgi:hypothetical protein
MPFIAAFGILRMEYSMFKISLEHISSERAMYKVAVSRKYKI